MEEEKDIVISRLLAEAGLPADPQRVIGKKFSMQFEDRTLTGEVRQVRLVPNQLDMLQLEVTPPIVLQEDETTTKEVSRLIYLLGWQAVVDLVGRCNGREKLYGSLLRDGVFQLL